MILLFLLLSAVLLAGPAHAARFTFAYGPNYTDGSTVPPSDVLGARVYCGPVAQPNPPHASQADGPAPYTTMATVVNGNTATVPGLPADTMIYCRVRAWSPVHKVFGPFSDEVSFRTPRPPDPKFPVVATVCVHTQMTVTVTATGQLITGPATVISNECPATMMAPAPVTTTLPKQNAPMTGKRPKASPPGLGEPKGTP